MLHNSRHFWWWSGWIAASLTISICNLLDGAIIFNMYLSQEFYTKGGEGRGRLAVWTFHFQYLELPVCHIIANIYTMFNDDVSRFFPVPAILEILFLVLSSPTSWKAPTHLLKFPLPPFPSHTYMYHALNKFCCCCCFLLEILHKLVLPGRIYWWIIRLTCLHWKWPMTHTSTSATSLRWEILLLVSFHDGGKTCHFMGETCK